jgi:hypothetical protein
MRVAGWRMAIRVEVDPFSTGQFMISQRLTLIALLFLVTGCESPTARYQQAVAQYEAEMETLRAIESELVARRGGPHDATRRALAERQLVQWRRVSAAKMRAERLAPRY